MNYNKYIIHNPKKLVLDLIDLKLKNQINSEEKTDIQNKYGKVQFYDNQSVQDLFQENR